MMDIRRYMGVWAALVLAVCLFLAGAAPAPAEHWQRAEGPLMTRWAQEVGPDNALPEYPRPQMRREAWQNLNGLWDYAVTAKAEERIPDHYDGKILVPYCIESALSGVMKPFLPSQKLWYRRTIVVPDTWIG